MNGVGLEHELSRMQFATTEACCPATEAGDVMYREELSFDSGRVSREGDFHSGCLVK